MHRERLLIGRIFCFEPAARIVGLWVGVEFGIPGDRQVDGMDNGSFGNEVPVVLVVLFNESRYTCIVSVSVLKSRNYRDPYLAGPAGAI